MNTPTVTRNLRRFTDTPQEGTNGYCPSEFECAACGTVWAPEITESNRCPGCGEAHDKATIWLLGDALRACLERLQDPYLGEDDGQRQEPEINHAKSALALAGM